MAFFTGFGSRRAASLAEHSVRVSALNSKIFLMATPFCVVQQFLLCKNLRVLIDLKVLHQEVFLCSICFPSFYHFLSRYSIIIARSALRHRFLIIDINRNMPGNKIEQPAYFFLSAKVRRPTALSNGTPATSLQDQCPAKQGK